MVRRTMAVSILALLLAAFGGADCGTERWAVKVATDPDTRFVNAAVTLPVTIEYLRSLTAPRPLPQNGRVQPVETSVYDVTATLIEYKVEDDGDYHLVLSDQSGRTVIAEIPSVGCSSGSAFANLVGAARLTFDRKLTASTSFQRVSLPVQVRGIGFFDFQHGQTGVAPNAIELHPVLDISFNPLIPPAPPTIVRHRAVGGGGRLTACTPPALTFMVSKSKVCSGEPVTLTWQSSDNTSRVVIDGIGSTLPASGSTTVGTTVSSAYSGHASNACGIGPEAVAEVTIQTGASASLSAPVPSIQVNQSTTLSATISNATGWNLFSALGNGLDPASGSTNGTFVINYAAYRGGSDTITLSANGSCGTIQRTTPMSIMTPQPQPQPQPQPGYLRCCDGTLSPSCTSCANKSGCCSHHGGVCGCP